MSGENDVVDLVRDEDAARKPEPTPKTKPKPKHKSKPENRITLPEEEEPVESDVVNPSDLRLLDAKEVKKGNDFSKGMVAMEGFYRRKAVGVLILGKMPSWPKNTVAAVRMTFERDEGSTVNNWTIAIAWDITKAAELRPIKLPVQVDKTSGQLVGIVPMKVPSRLRSLPGAKRYDDVVLKVGAAYKTIHMDMQELAYNWKKYTSLTKAQKLRRTLRTSQMRERAKNAVVRSAKLLDADKLPTKMANKLKKKFAKKMELSAIKAKLQKGKASEPDQKKEEEQKKKVAPLIDPVLLTDIEPWGPKNEVADAFGACPKYAPSKSLAATGIIVLKHKWTSDPRRDNAVPGSDAITKAVRDFLVENRLRRAELKKAQACAAKGSKVLSPFAHQLVFDAVMRPDSVVEKALVHWRTGSGKTYAMISVLKNFYSDSRPKIILVPNQSIRLNFYSAILAPDTPNPYQAYVRWYLTGPFYVPAVKIDSDTRMSLVPFAQSKPHIFKAWACEKCGTKNVFRVSCKKCRLLHPRARKEAQNILAMKGKLQCVGQPSTLTSPLRIFTYARAGGPVAGRRDFPILKYAYNGNNSLEQTKRVAVFEDVVQAFVDADVVKADNPYNHCIVVCDEVHNMWDRTSRYRDSLKQMFNWVRESIDTVFVGMTATPLTTLSAQGMQKQYAEIMSMLQGALYTTSDHCLRRDLAERSLAVRLKFAGSGVNAIKRRVKAFEPVFGDTKHGYIFDFDMLDPAIYPRVVPPISELGRVCPVGLGSYNLLMYLHKHKANKIPCDLATLESAIAKQDLAGGSCAAPPESFADCARCNPVMESLPEQCFDQASNRHFVKGEDGFRGGVKQKKKKKKALDAPQEEKPAKKFELKNIKSVGPYCNSFFTRALGAFNFGKQWKAMQAATLYGPKLYSARRTSTKLTQIIQDILRRPQEKTLVIVDQSFSNFELLLDALYREKGTRWAAFKNTKEVRVSDDPRLATNFQRAFSVDGQRDFVSFVSSVLRAANGKTANGKATAKSLVHKLIHQLKQDIRGFANVAKEVSEYVDLSARLNAKSNALIVQSQSEFNVVKQDIQDQIENNEGEQEWTAFNVVQQDGLKQMGFKASDVSNMRRLFVARATALDKLVETDYVLKDVQRCIVQTKKRFLDHHLSQRPTLKTGQNLVEFRNQLEKPFAWARSRFMDREPDKAEKNETERLMQVARAEKKEREDLEAERELLAKLQEEQKAAEAQGPEALEEFLKKRDKKEKKFASKGGYQSEKYKRYKARLKKRAMQAAKRAGAEAVAALRATWEEEAKVAKAKKKAAQKQKDNRICVGTKATKKWVDYYWKYTSDVPKNPLATKFNRVVRKLYNLRLAQLRLELRLLEARTEFMVESIGTRRLETFVVEPEAYKRRAMAFIDERVKPDMTVPVYKKIARLIDEFIAKKKAEAAEEEKQIEAAIAEAQKQKQEKEEKTSEKAGEKQTQEKEKEKTAVKKEKKRPDRKAKLRAQLKVQAIYDTDDEGDDDEEWSEEESASEQEEDVVDAAQDTVDFQELLQEAEVVKQRSKSVVRKASFNLETFEQAFEDMLDETKQKIKQMFCKFVNQQVSIESDPQARYEHVLSQFNSFTPSKGLNKHFGAGDGKGAIRTLVINAEHFSEGVSFFGVQRLIMVEVARNYTDHRQRVGRVLRACKSHGFLPSDERVVHVDQYIAEIDQASTKALLNERAKMKRPVYVEVDERKSGKARFKTPTCTVDGISMQMLEKQKGEVDAFMRENFEAVSLDAGLYAQEQDGEQEEPMTAYPRVRYKRAPTSTEAELKVFGPDDADIKINDTLQRPWANFVPSERQANAHYKEERKEERTVEKKPQKKSKKKPQEKKQAFDCSIEADDVVKPVGFLDQQERELEQQAWHAERQRRHRAFRTQKRNEHEAAWAPQQKKELEKAVVNIGKPASDLARDAMLTAVRNAVFLKKKVKTPELKELLKRVRQALTLAKKAFMKPLAVADKEAWKALIKPETDKRRKQSAKRAAKTRKMSQTADNDREFARTHARNFDQLLSEMNAAFEKDERKTRRAHVPNSKYMD